MIEPYKRMKKNYFYQVFQKMKIFKFTLALTSVVAQYRLTYGYGSKSKNFLDRFCHYFFLLRPKKDMMKSCQLLTEREQSKILLKRDHLISHRWERNGMYNYWVAQNWPIFRVVFKNHFCLRPPRFNLKYKDKCHFL